jgi:pyruvate,water dikinase
LTRPGAWQTGAVPLQVGDFLTSMLRMPDLTTQSDSDLCPNLAVASHEYLNLSLRFGYHFAVLDCYCSEQARFNHVYFRFFGGATDLSKRSRRVRFIAAVLGEHGFTIQTGGDLITARLAGVGRGELEKVLDQVGRLLAYTRQLDARLPDDAALEQAVREFLSDRYLTGG